MDGPEPSVWPHVVEHLSVSWDTSIWRDSKSDGSLLTVPGRVRGRKGGGDKVTAEFTVERDDDEQKPRW